MACMLIRAIANLALSFLSHWTWLPSPGGTPVTTISNAPPRLSPDSLALSIAFFIFSETTLSGHLTSLDSASLKLLEGSFPRAFEEHLTPPISTTKLTTFMPNSERNSFATAPTATLAAVSLALERSRISLTSSVPYFKTPVRSACPGLGRVTASAFEALRGSTAIRSSQLAQSRLGITRVTGEPRVLPNLTPPVISTLSFSMDCLLPLP